MNTLTLSIANCLQLRQGMTRHHRFDRSGGTIGGQAADWQLLDRCQGVLPIHCEIRWAEDCFCVVDHGNRTFLNGSSRSVGRQGAMRLRDGDQLSIGRFVVQVRYQERMNTGSVEGLFIRQQEVIAALPPAHPDARGLENIADRAPPEICQAFHHIIGYDPLLALDTSPAAAAQPDDLQGFIGGVQP
ncbi:FHA domain-containing protein [Pseudomonas sp. S31]|uniref:FHA domain-containing protein n=1 Tax=Pseudomonas sp. S31 TaxID=1564473 RepID=UPI001912DB3D|nr:FHA domain-containing protein [Pseudomonas sp. S31]MBK4998182.1 FHA domain-containing protein [Pseudomonas sp. S31]